MVAISHALVVSDSNAYLGESYVFGRVRREIYFTDDAAHLSFPDNPASGKPVRSSERGAQR